MGTRPEVVGEIRSLFKHGATPSRLFRHIAERHEDEPNLRFLIHDYFQEAFGVPIVRGLRANDDYHQTDLRYAFHNQALLSDMVQRKGEWDSNGGDTWLNSVHATDPAERLEQVEADIPNDLARCWSMLTPQERRFIHLAISSGSVLGEQLNVLSALCESLQQQLIADTVLATSSKDGI